MQLNHNAVWWSAVLHVEQTGVGTVLAGTQVVDTGVRGGTRATGSY